MDARAIALAIPFFLLLIGVEVWVDLRRRRRGEAPLFNFPDAITSLACGIGQQVLGALAIQAIGVAAYAFVWSHRVVDLSAESPLTWLFAFVGVDLGYYAYHRASHRVNFFWATHVVHHQSEEYNLATALRQAWFTGVTSWVFYVPLAILGVPPLVFALSYTFNILYQFWIHTRTVKRLGFLESFLNTPSHHRVHHGIDPEYIDANYAGVLIVWDKVFGSFIEEKHEPAYGTVKPLASFNPFWANVEGFVRLWEMSRKTRRLRDKLLVWVMPPEWQPEDLGGVVTVPPVDHATRVKYDVPPSRAVFRYVGVQFVLAAALVFAVLWYATALSLPERGALVAVAMTSLGVWSGLFERRAWAVPVEIARLVAQTATLAWIARASASAPIVAAVSAAVGVACAAMLLRAVRSDRAAARRPVAALVVD